MLKMTLSPRISVLVPSFNEAHQVIEKSLRSLMAQTFSDFECIVIDESTDSDKADFCRNLCSLDPRFVYVHPEQRLGLAGSLNLGLQKARGEWIARFDSDDVCDLDRFAKQIAFLDENQEIGVLGGALDIIDDEDRVVAKRSYPLTHNEIEKTFVFANSIAHPTVMIKRDLLCQCGAYNPDFRYSEDLELWLRMLNAGVKFANLPNRLVFYRQQMMRRPANNWKFNIQARWMHIGSKYLLRKMLTIALMRIWMWIPAAIQESFYKILVLKKRA